MINYSVSYRSRYVDENGQRVKKAYAYGTAKAAGTLTMAQFADYATAKSVYGSGVLQAMIVVLAQAIIDKAKLSYSVNCGSLGTFAPGLSSKGVEDINNFSAGAHITKSYVKWNKPATLKAIQGAEYRMVSTNEDAQAANKANKNASATVNLGDSSVKELARTQNLSNS